MTTPPRAGEPEPVRPGSSRADRLRRGWARFVEPRADGLPNRRVIAIPLLLLAAVFVGLVALGITGTSSGVVHPLISTQPDPDLIAGSPQGWRSDEWFVQTTWTISQVEQGLPPRNETFPGGMDATVHHDLPAHDWSSAFRPHLLGFQVLPLDQAMAVKWWLPGFSLIAFAYLFTVALLPRRPIAAMALAVAFYFSPFFQWWYLSITFWAPAWALLVMASVLWCLRSRGRVGRWVFGGLLAYLTVTLGTGIYVPFIVPAALIAFGFSVGAVLTGPEGGAPFVRNIARIVPVLIAGIVAASVLVVWLVTRRDTVSAFLSTVYPGERLQTVGQAGLIDLEALFGGPLSVALARTGGQPFAANSPEASTFLLPGLFLFAVMIWLVVDRIRRKCGVDWISVCLLAVGMVMFAFLLIPGWDAIAHLVFLDRSTYGRMRVGFGLLSLAMIVIVALRVHERSKAGLPRMPWWVAALGAALAVLVAVRTVWVVVSHFGVSFILDQVPLVAVAAGVVLLCMFVAVVWLYGAGALGWGTALLLVLSLISAAWVNPVYRGVLDLRQTEIAAEVEQINSEQPGEWVGVTKGQLVTMLLVQTGSPSFNGFQSSPAPRMWDQIDPNGSYEAVWNRLANVSWVAGSGDPAPHNPAPDQIELTFDSCATFAQENVRWVLTDEPLDQTCLTLESTIDQGPTQLRIYEIQPAP